MDFHFSSSEIGDFDQFLDMLISFLPLFFPLSLNFLFLQFFLSFQKFGFILNLSRGSVQTSWEVIQTFFSGGNHLFEYFGHLLPVRPSFQILFHYLKFLCKLKFWLNFKVLFSSLCRWKVSICVSFLLNIFSFFLSLLHVSQCLCLRLFLLLDCLFDFISDIKFDLRF